MKRISSIEVSLPYQIICIFDDGNIKLADLSDLLKMSVFEPIRNPLNFQKAENRGYYIEWKDWELDLSADTLWHIGKPVQIETFTALAP